VLEIEAGGVSEALTQPKRDDAEEVLNYRRAMSACVAEMEHRLFSQQILRSAHQGVRGHDKRPGSYRIEQNWIGPKGCTLESANFVPIPPEHLVAGMDMWERCFGSTAEKDIWVQLALVHLEFEALHPFMDGNGRLGRMLIPLFLYQRRLLSSPAFYMSGYLERNREEYQERLRAVSRDNAWTQWCLFFLKAIQEQADENVRKANAILALYGQTKTRIARLTHSQYAMYAADFLFRGLIFSAPDFIQHSGIPKATASRILNLLRKDGILSTLREGRGGRSGIYVFDELLSIAEDT